MLPCRSVSGNFSPDGREKNRAGFFEELYEDMVVDATMDSKGKYVTTIII